MGQGKTHYTVAHLCLYLTYMSYIRVCICIYMNKTLRKRCANGGCQGFTTGILRYHGCHVVCSPTSVLGIGSLSPSYPQFSLSYSTAEAVKGHLPRPPSALIISRLKAEGMAQPVETLATKPDHLSWVPGTHMDGENRLPKLSSNLHKCASPATKQHGSGPVWFQLEAVLSSVHPETDGGCIPQMIRPRHPSGQQRFASL